MDVHALLAPDAKAPLGESRARVLDLLRAAPGPLGVQEIAGQVGLHPNTARFHLDALVEAGLATRAPRPRETPGRPIMVYQAMETDGPTGQRRYRLLAEMLTSMIAGVMPTPGEEAADAGREWGRYLTEQPPPYQRLGPGEAMGKLTEALAQIGFAPEAAAEGGGYRLRLHQCPFREVAERHQDVVCALHLGLMQGVLEQLRAPVTADRLRPFAEPSVCIADLSAGRAQAAAAARPGTARRVSMTG
ncbi:MAG TPA: helix-turn-helix domain-containing protein [Streptosporangiaceae bacterium]|jgi:predicted ArsR family transcriptional regulator|nr:helix-turn-helix domain-containing protein [Streptosporangiaceae bacterium]